ncbi:MAG: hypothetical protein GXP42_12990 [Chloroflexi bacterium]|nr:hypothetical protein [Chloroflexota bacterium]
MTNSAPFEISDELLSAYLDGEVTTAERARIEQALADDPEVRERLESLRWTVSLLREAPRLSVPRAFILSETEVLAAGGKVKGVRQPGWMDRWLAGLSRAMPAATAAVAVLLLFVVGVDLLMSRTSQPQAVRMEAPAAEIALQATQAPGPEAEIAQPSGPEVATTVVVEKVVEATVLVEKEAAAMEAPEATAPPPLSEADKTEFRAIEVQKESAEAEVRATESPVEEKPMDETAVMGEEASTQGAVTPAEVSAPTQEVVERAATAPRTEETAQLQPTAPPGEKAAQPQPTAPQPAPPPSPWRLLELGLLLLLAVMLIVTFLLRRVRSKI